MALTAPVVKTLGIIAINLFQGASVAVAQVHYPQIGLLVVYRKVSAVHGIIHQPLAIERRTGEGETLVECLGVEERVYPLAKRSAKEAGTC